MKQLIDRFGRVHEYLRFSLIDRCNLNCFYCNPKKSNNNSLRKNEILTFEEIIRLIKIFVINHGIKKIRFTGGEPLIRKNILSLFRQLKEFKKEKYFQLALTSNGVSLYQYLPELQQNGLDRINISLDTMSKKKFKKITGYNLFDNVMKSIENAEELGFLPVNINTVVMNGVNDDELLDFVDFAKNRNINIRFIEYMPFGDNNWDKTDLFTYMDMKRVVETKFRLKYLDHFKNSVAKDYEIIGHIGRVSFISSISDHFCNKCNRLRISSDGKMKLCLFTNGIPALDFKKTLRNPDVSDNDISRMIEKAVLQKDEKHPSVDDILTFEKNNMLQLGG